MFPIIYNYYIEHFHIKIMLFEHVLTEIVVAEKKSRFASDRFGPIFVNYEMMNYAWKSYATQK